MNKARTMLTALGVLVIAGGALAFKARNNHVLYTGEAGSGICTVPVTGYTFGGIRLVAVSIIPNSIDCPDRYVTFIANDY
ncbi:hypothetical protein [Chitinophaga sp. MM2321]|uniref:hypothetical protein n=1 Tax=Chitinophaga sp. MM2321 TaxID=3137178 RepID=UPI0032D569FA